MPADKQLLHLQEVSNSIIRQIFCNESINRTIELLLYTERFGHSWTNVVPNVIFKNIRHLHTLLSSIIQYSWTLYNNIKCDILNAMLIFLVFSYNNV